MTTAIGNRTMEPADRSRCSLEELVDLLIETPLPAQTEMAEPSVTRSVHEVRRLGQAGNMDGALAAAGNVNTATTTQSEARWALSEWKRMVKRRFGDRGATFYSQGEGRVAALADRGDGTLEAVLVPGMRWQPGKVVSECSLRGLRPTLKS